MTLPGPEPPAMSFRGATRPVPFSGSAHRAFEDACRSMGLDPSNLWVGGYVDYQWNHLGPILDAYRINLRNREVLEFGCNVGASAIVLAHLGARVHAIDVSSRLVALARANAERYGAASIEFICVRDTRSLPFDTHRFDLVYCGSVLEYIESSHRVAVQREIDRIVRPGGIILIGGTSSRLWPREIHSGKWLVNYLPRAIDRVWGASRARGISPLAVRYGFGRHYDNLDAKTRGRAFLESRLRMNSSPLAVRLLVSLAARLGVGPGLLAHSISCVLVKRV